MIAQAPAIFGCRALSGRTGGPIDPRHLLALFAVALGIRVVAVALVQPQLGTDSAGYIAAGQALLNGGPRALTTMLFDHAPLYSVFLTIGLTMPGLDIGWFAVLSQAVLGAATVVVVARFTARETRCARAGISTGLLAAIHISFVFWTAYVVSETLFLFLLALCADGVLALRASTSIPRDAGRAGVLALLLVAARPTGSVLLVAVVALVVMSAARRSGRDAAVLIASFSLPIVVVVGAGIGAGLAGPGVGSVPGSIAHFARSAIENGLVWTESGRATSGVDLDVWPPPIVDTLAPDQRPEFLHNGPLAFAARHPDFAVAQAARKLRMFWSLSLPEYSLRHGVLSSVYFGLFFALALVGIVHARRARFLITLSVLSVVLLTLTSVITIVDYDLRYRLPAELFLIPLAGVGWASLVRRRFT